MISVRVLYKHLSCLLIVFGEFVTTGLVSSNVIGSLSMNTCPKLNNNLHLYWF